MRLAATVLAAFLVSIPTAWSQDPPAAEPPLAAVIAHFFPGHAPVALGELNGEIGALTVSDPAYDSADRSPTVIRGDFDGNGHTDYALLIRRDSPAPSDEIFAILMGHGEGRYAKAIESYFGGIAPDIYLGYLPPGTSLPAVAEGDGVAAARLVLDNPAVTLNILGRVSDAFYWDAATGSFGVRTLPR